MDRRTKRTKNLIYNAFVELLLKEKYSKITIQQIIELADIGRSTFYSHFETKDELLKAMCTDIFDQMHANNQAASNGNHNLIIVNILYHIKENERTIKGVFLSESAELFIKYFKNYFGREIEQCLPVSYDEKITGIPKDFLINHIYGSFLEMVKWWISGGVKYTPEELARYFMSVIYPVFMEK